MFQALACTIRCPNSCEFDYILDEDMEAYKATCPLQKIGCPNDCGKVLQQQFMANHTEVDCPCRVDCYYCQLSEEYQFIEGQHKQKCSKFPINCTNECEVGSIPHETIVTHRQECPLLSINFYNNIEFRNTMVPPVIMQMPDYTNKKSPWCNDPFYTKEKGQTAI